MNLMAHIEDVPHRRNIKTHLVVAVGKMEAKASAREGSGAVPREDSERPHVVGCALTDPRICTLVFKFLCT